MPNLKLSYFDMDGGRGEAARLALSIGGIPFEDERIAFADWPKFEPSTPFHAIPVLEIDGQTLAQSNGINRYVGKLAGLYPEDALQAAFCDEAMDVVEDITVPIVATFSMDEAEKQAARKVLVAETLGPKLEQLGRRLDERGGEWFADARLTVADLKVFVWIRHLLSGNLDHLPTDLTAKRAPGILQHHDRVTGHPGVEAYYASRAGAAT